MITTNQNFENYNAAPGQKPIALLSIAGYSRVFTTALTGVAGQYPWIVEAGEISTTVRETEGSSSMGGVDITVNDQDSRITQDMATFTFEGRTATLKYGYAGMSQSDFITLATLLVDSVDAPKGGATVVFHLADFTRQVQNIVYLTGDDGLATSSDHLKTVSGNPCDILNDVLLTQLALDAARVNSSAIAALKAGLLSGLVLRFALDTAPTADSWLQTEILKALGGYWFWNSLGQFTPVFLLPWNAPANIVNVSQYNIPDDAIPELAPADVINLIRYRFDAVKRSEFSSEFVDVYAASFAAGLPSGEFDVDARGVTGVFMGWPWAGLLANTMFLRYGGHQNAAGAIVSKNLTYSFDVFPNPGLKLEVGDFVRLSHPAVPDRANGIMGLAGRLCQVLETRKNILKGRTSLKVLDVDWLDRLGRFAVAADGTPDWTAADDTARGANMFICDHATGNYSDGQPGHTIY